jgi:hypothetical protein
MKRYVIPALIAILVLASGLLIACGQKSSTPTKTESPSLPPTTQAPSLPTRIFTLTDMVYDSHYWNSSWDAASLYQALISTNRTYHQNHTYIEGVFDCDEMATDIWNILYKQGVTSVIVVGNLDIDKERFTKSDHAWLLVMHKDTGYRIFIIEPTNGETYAFNLETKAFAQYLQGYFFASPSDFRGDTRER